MTLRAGRVATHRPSPEGVEPPSRRCPFGIGLSELETRLGLGRLDVKLRVHDKTAAPSLRRQSAALRQPIGHNARTAH